MTQNLDLAIGPACAASAAVQLHSLRRVAEPSRGQAASVYFLGTDWCSRRASAARRNARSVAAALLSTFSFFIAVAIARPPRNGHSASA